MMISRATPAVNTSTPGMSLSPDCRLRGCHGPRYHLPTVELSTAERPDSGPVCLLNRASPWPSTAWQLPGHAAATALQ